MNVMTNTDDVEFAKLTLPTARKIKISVSLTWTNLKKL